MPPLAMLRSFEAAARQGSVTRAAEELHVTQSAVSHQIKLLEQWLGVKLVAREGRRLALTAQGAAYLPSLSNAFDLMAQATARIEAQPQRARLTVNALPTVAAQWLIPRLPAFCAEMPDVDVQVLTTAALLDFDPAAFDVSLRCLSDGERDRAQQRRGWRDVGLRPFLPEAVTPVCSPAYLKRRPALKSPADLRRLALIHSRSADRQWEQWFAVAGATHLPVESNLVFDHTHQAVQAAMQGLGVALASTDFVAEALTAGLLVAPFGGICLQDRHYYWIVPPRQSDSDIVRRFCRWLEAQGGAAAGHGPGTSGPPAA